MPETNQPVLPTTTVGSFPKPDYLKKARSEFAKKKISREELEKLEEKATREIIAFQEEIGLDILVDGEMYRGDMTTYFAENLEGCKISGLVRSYGNRYYRKPVVVGKLHWKEPITLRWWKYAQSLTQKPVKGMLTGPYTMMDWSFNEYYASRREVALGFAEVIAQEALALESAGATLIQIDEPAVSTKPTELPLAIEVLGNVTKKLKKAKTVSHMCYGNFALLYPKLLELPVDQLDLELANSDFELLEYFRKNPFSKEIGLGVLDVHSHVIESKELIKERLQKAIQVIPLEKIYVDPDCGLKTRTLEESKRKLLNMVAAVHEFRAELVARA